MSTSQVSFYKNRVGKFEKAYAHLLHIYSRTPTPRWAPRTYVCTVRSPFSHPPPTLSSSSMGYNGHHHRSDVAARRIKATKLLILVGRTYHHCLPIVKKGKHSERFNWQRDPSAAGLQKHSPHVVLASPSTAKFLN